MKVTDSETPPLTATAPLAIIIRPNGGGSGALSGNYAFFLNGFDSTGAWTLAGSFIADGNGTITSGTVDGNSISGMPFNSAVTGSYSVATSGLNTLTIQGDSYGPVTFAFVLSSSGNGKIIEYDDATGQGSRGSGILRKQDPAAFSLDRLSGGYVFGLSGVDASASRFVDVGVFTLSSGDISNGECDINDGGFYSICTFWGHLSSIDAQTGRGVSTILSSNGPSRQATYVVSASELIMEQIDPIDLGQLLVGSVIQQSGTFNNGTMNGTAVLYMQAIHDGDNLDQSVAGIFSFDGNGIWNSLVMDEDTAGTIQQDAPQEGNYAVAANGALTFTGGGNGVPVGFLVSRDHGFFVTTGSNTNFGVIEPQTGAPFSNQAIAGSYAGGSTAPLDYASASNEVDTGSGNGDGVLTSSANYSEAGGLGQDLGAIINYSIASNGRGTGEAQGDTAPSVIYVISPAKFLVMMPKVGAQMEVFEH